MKVEVSDKEVKITIGNEILVSDFEDIVKIFKDAKDDRERRHLAIVHCVGSYFKRVTKGTSLTKKLNTNTLDVLEGCVQVARKYHYNYELENDIDELLGSDPYLPLY